MWRMMKKMTECARNAVMLDEEISRAHFGKPFLFLGWYRLPRYPATTAMHGNYWMVTGHLGTHRCRNRLPR